ncbi:MAG: DUF4760 domain-containing protein [Thiomicrospira sp.]|jgi:hypothetical protein
MSCSFLLILCEFLSPLAILLSAMIGASVAMWAIFTNRRLARQKNSMDIINSHGKDEDIRLAIKEAGNLKHKVSNDMQMMAHDITGEETAHIRKVLNYFESLAVCVEHKIYDDKILKETLYTTVIDLWDICSFLPCIHKRPPRPAGTTRKEGN